MKNFLLFLLGFVLVFSAGLAFAGYPGECKFVFYTNQGGFSSEYSFQSLDSVTLYPTGGISGLIKTLKNPGGYTNYGVQEGYFESGSWHMIGMAYNNQKVVGAPGGPVIGILNPDGISAVMPACPPPPCEPPNAINASGNCVPCPSGNFAGDYCIPLCDYSHAYIPDMIYNPEGATTCVQPPCGSGQIANAEGRCVPNCGEGEKLDTMTGACVPDCVFGTHAEGATCVPDCGPGYMKDGETGTCIPNHDCLSGEEIVNGECAPRCLPGEIRDGTGVCRSPAATCPFGQHKDENDQCVSTPVNCPPGTAFNETEHTCKAAPVQQDQNTTVVNNPNGGTTTTTNNTTTISNGSGGSMTAGSTTVTTTGAGGIGGTTNTTYTPPDLAKYESPPHSLNWEGWNSQVRRAAEEGPVKLLHKVKDIVAWFDVQPAAPVFQASVGGHSFNIDLSMFDGIAAVCRFVFSCLMTVGVFWFGFRLFGLL